MMTIRVIVDYASTTKMSGPLYQLDVCVHLNVMMIKCSYLLLFATTLALTLIAAKYSSNGSNVTLHLVLLHSFEKCCFQLKIFEFDKQSRSSS
jgi:hypothetical protein